MTTVTPDRYYHKFPDDAFEDPRVRQAVAQSPAAMPLYDASIVWTWQKTNDDVIDYHLVTDGDIAAWLTAGDRDVAVKALLATDLWTDTGKGYSVTALDTQDAYHLRLNHFIREPRLREAYRRSPQAWAVYGALIAWSSAKSKQRDRRRRAPTVPSGVIPGHLIASVVQWIPDVERALAALLDAGLIVVDPDALAAVPSLLANVHVAVSGCWTITNFDIWQAPEDLYVSKEALKKRRQRAARRAAQGQEPSTGDMQPPGVQPEPRTGDYGEPESGPAPATVAPPATAGSEADAQALLAAHNTMCEQHGIVPTGTDRLQDARALLTTAAMPVSQVAEIVASMRTYSRPRPNAAPFAWSPSILASLDQVRRNWPAMRNDFKQASTQAAPAIAAFAATPDYDS